MKAKSLTPLFVESVPTSLKPGNLYVSMKYETAVHLCACGCGTKVVTPFGPHDWAVTFDGTVSLRPSVGNGQQQCRSHYYIRNDQIEWLPHISRKATQFATARDRAAHAQQHPADPHALVAPCMASHPSQPADGQAVALQLTWTPGRPPITPDSVNKGVITLCYNASAFTMR